MQDVCGADTSEIGAFLRILLGKQAEVVRRMDCACSRGNLGGVSRVSRRHVAIWGRKTYLGDECTFINVAEASEVVLKRQARS